VKENIFFVVHDEESYEGHSDLVGFGVKTDLNGKLIRNKRGEPIPENQNVPKVRSGDKIVYYTRGDFLIKGIFTVERELKEGDSQRAKDWSRTNIQFKIKPYIKPKTDVDFRNIVFSGKNTLDMFSHLSNLKKQWGMAIGGRNYIKQISPHDLQIIQDALEKPQEFEAEEAIVVPEFSRYHLTYQFELVRILKSYSLRVHVARNDKAKIKEKGEDVLDTVPEFHNERIRDIASRIDCIGFSETNIPRILVEVVDTVGTLTESLYRLNEVALVYPKSVEQRFYVVGPETTRNDFNEKIESATFKSLKNADCSFRAYEEIERIFQESQKKKPKL
jgi:hypothetical protein